MSGPIGPTGPCPHGVVDNICQLCTAKNYLSALVEVCDARDIAGYQVEDARDFVLYGAGVAPVEGPPSPRYPALTLAGICTVVMDIIVEHHKTPEGIVGGLLHVQLDDGNLEDTFWEAPFNDEVQGIWERAPTQLETCIAALMKALPLAHRQSVYDGAWIVMHRGLKGE